MKLKALKFVAVVAALFLFLAGCDTDVTVSVKASDIKSVCETGKMKYVPAVIRIEGLDPDDEDDARVIANIKSTVRFFNSGRKTERDFMSGYQFKTKLPLVVMGKNGFVFADDAKDPMALVIEKTAGNTVVNCQVNRACLNKMGSASMMSDVDIKKVSIEFENDLETKISFVSVGSWFDDTPVLGGQTVEVTPDNSTVITSSDVAADLLKKKRNATLFRCNN